MYLAWGVWPKRWKKPVSKAVVIGPLSQINCSLSLAYDDDEDGEEKEGSGRWLNTSSGNCGSTSHG